MKDKSFLVLFYGLLTLALVLSFIFSECTLPNIYIVLLPILMSIAILMKKVSGDARNSNKRY